MMMILMDTDGNGALSLEEVQAVHERIFRAVDEDDDGQVTPEEIQAFMRGGMGPATNQ
jgi:Ca2+-binding EF-hand superfamily protein